MSVALTFALSNVLFRLVEHRYNPAEINFYRTLIGFLTFLIIVLIEGSISLIISLSLLSIVLLVLSGFFGQVLGDSLYFLAQKRIGISIALPLSLTFPLWTNLYSVILMIESVTLNEIISLILILVGIFIFSRPHSNKNRTTNNDDNNKNLAIGIIIALIVANTWAIGGILLNFVSDLDSSTHANIVRLFPSIFFIFLISKFDIFANQNKEINEDTKLKDRSILVTSSIIGTSIGAYLFVLGIFLLGAAKASIIYSTSPIFALPISFLLIKDKEPISKHIILGSLIVVFGIIIVLL